MPENAPSNKDLQNNSIESKIGEVLRNLNLNKNQINKIKELITEKIKKEGAEKNSIKEKKIIAKFKKIIENSNTIEEGIQKIENELSEITKEMIGKEGTIKVSEGEPEISNDIKSGASETNNDNFFKNEELLQNEKQNLQNEKQNLQNEKQNLQNEGTETIKLNKSFSEAIDCYNKINNKYKPTDEEIAQQKDSIPEETKKRLAENNIPEEQYLRFSIAREKIYQTGNEDNTPETKAFLNSLKDFENKLGITKQGLPLSASTKIFEENPQLRDFKDNNKAIQELNNITYFGKEKIDINNQESINQAVEKYKKIENMYLNSEHYPEDKAEDNYKFSEISKKINNNEEGITNEEKIFYIDKLENANGWITEYCKMTAAQAPLTCMLNYLDSYNESYKDTLSNRLGKENNEFINVEKDEKGKSTMWIKGIIDGKPISFYYDTTDGNANIRCDDILKTDITNNHYELYNEGGNHTKPNDDINDIPKSALNISNIPNTKDIVNTIKDISEEEYTELLQGSNNIKEFKAKIASLITNKVNDTFPKQQEVKTRMARFTEKNLTAQTFDSVFIGNQTIKQELTNRVKEGSGITPIRRMLLLVDNTTEKNTSSDLVELKQGFNEIGNLLGKSNEELNRIKDPVARECLINIKLAKEKEKYEEWEKAMTKFFSLFEHRNEASDSEFVMDIDDFTAFIELANKDEISKESKLENNFSPKFIEKYNAINPEEAERQRIQEEQKEKNDNYLARLSEENKMIQDSAGPELDAKLQLI